MFVDASAMVSILGEEPEATRCAFALEEAAEPFTSAIAVWESVIALARPDKFGSFDLAEEAVKRLLNGRSIAVRALPPEAESVKLSLEAARNYRTGKGRLNLADCFHYACAKHYGVPILSTANEFRFTDIETIP